MGTLLRLAIVLAGLWLVLRMVKRYLTRNQDSLPPSGTPSSGDMLRCDYCGTFVPRTEAIHSGTKHYCSGQHAESDRTKS